MLENYLPIIVFFIIGILFGVLPITMGMLLAPRKKNQEKYAPFECGFPAFEDSRMQFDIRYYLVAVLFILFDLEVTFVFPWAVVYDELGWFGFNVMAIFLFLLVVGFIFEWKKGALEWE